MTLPTIDQARSWRGLTLVATDDQPVGKIEAIYVDRTTRQPEWALVDTGLFGGLRTFVPLADAAQRGDTVQVPHELSTVREAPRLEQDAELSEEDEARLYAHYGIEYTTEESTSGLPAGETTADTGAGSSTDATTELPPSSRLEADVPAAPTTGTAPTAEDTRWSEAAADHRWSDDLAREWGRIRRRGGEIRVGRPARGIGRVLARGRQRVLPRRRLRFQERDLGREAPQQHLVSSGFATQARPRKPLRSHRCLRPGTEYVYWFEVGDPVAGAIDEQEGRTLPVSALPPGTRLKVALFAYPGELEIAPGRDLGELMFLEDSSIAVARQPGQADAATPVERRLRFPVRTPAKPGLYRLRCNLYYEQTLLQSRLIEARVASRIRRRPRSLRSKVDFSVSGTLDQAQLAALQPQRLSIMLNDNGNGTHGFRFLGEEELKGDATLDADELQSLLDIVRSELRLVSWGKEKEWDDHDKELCDQYAGRPDYARLSRHLMLLAKVGYRLYDGIVDRLAGAVAGQLAGNQDLTEALAARMRRPGLVEIVSKESIRMVVPAALIYDHPLDSNATLATLALCSSASEALRGGADLTRHRCFEGDCPAYGNVEVVCPSGFWGFRHDLGLPPSLANGERGDAVDEAPVIKYEAMPALTVAVSTDPEFRRRELHAKNLQALRNPVAWKLGLTRSETLTLLRETSPQIVYFFCHGGVAQKTPYLQVGPPNESPITRDNLRAYKIQWAATRPLVFLNGCHTTALEPRYALEFVSAFVQKAHAAGVIGTEITVFENLACDFAEECMRRFLVDGDPIGKAVRDTRLALLARGNPLGLVYIPYVRPSLRLVPTEALPPAESR
jgi:hypothetical protein